MSEDERGGFERWFRNNSDSGALRMLLCRSIGRDKGIAARAQFW